MSVRLTCIICPNGCELTVTEGENPTVEGNLCPKGVRFALDELTAPVRSFTGTVATAFKDVPVVSVKTDRDIPLQMMIPVARAVAALKLDRRLEVGETAFENIAGSGANLIITGEMKI